MGRMGRTAAVTAVMALALAFSAGTIVAQVSADAGAEFVGEWTLEFEPLTLPGGGSLPAGGFGGGGGAGASGRMGGPQVLAITVADGQLAASLTGGLSGGTSITNISKSADALVLSYAISPGGQTIPIVLTLTPDGGAMKAAMRIAERVTRNGTATKK